MLSGGFLIATINYAEEEVVWVTQQSIIQPLKGEISPMFEVERRLFSHLSAFQFRREKMKGFVHL